MNTIYTTNGNDGLGSVLSIQQLTYAYSRMYNYNFHYEGFKYLDHYQSHNLSQKEFCNSLNEFINLPNESNENLEYIHHKTILEWAKHNINNVSSIIESLADRINYKDVCYFDKNVTNVCVHIRSLNKNDSCFAQFREYYTKNSEKDFYFQTVIKNIIEKEKCKVLIFSEGNPESFSHYQDMFNCELHLNEDMVKTFYHMIFSDILVTSNSSLSWAAHLYNKNKIVYTRDSSNVNWYKNTRLLNIKGI